MLKVLSIVGGLAGAAGLSQYPEFSQQYTQRLAGQVDALTVVVADFEASAFRAGLTRMQAFEQMIGTPFLEDRQADMRRTFTRHAALSDDLVRLRAATPMQRLTLPNRLLDADTLSKTWDDFKPAVPLSIPGVVAAGGGFIAGWAIVGLLLVALRSLFRRGFATRDVSHSDRKEPVVTRPRRIGES